MGNLMNTYEDAIPVAFPPQTPLIIGFDNINIYKGHARFARLQKSMAPIMWNLTVRMARKPNVEDIQDRTSGRTSTQPVNHRKMCCH